MHLTALASGLLWVFSMLLPASSGFASRLGLDPPALRTPESARFRLDGQVQVGPTEASLHGQGAFAQPDRFQLSLEAMGERLEQVVIGDAMYVRTPDQTRWEVVDLRETVGQASPLGPFPFAPGKEREALEALRSLTVVGDEPLAGVATRHYRGELDLLQLLGEVFGSARELREEISSFKISLDLWVGTADGYLHQIKLTVDLEPAGSSLPLSDALHADLTLAFLDFNRPVSIVAPIGPTPPAQIPAGRSQAPLRAPAQLPRTGLAPLQLAVSVSGLVLVVLGIGLRASLVARR
jgi:hypothetical protein